MQGRSEASRSEGDMSRERKSDQDTNKIHRVMVGRVTKAKLSGRGKEGKKENH